MSIAYLQNTNTPSNLSTYTFSAQNIGTAASDRYIICALTGRADDGGARTITSVTIGGVTATENVDYSDNGNSIGIFSAAVPSGTTADVVVVFSSTMTDCDIALYSTNKLVSTTATNSGTSNANPGTYNINVVAGGFAIAIARDDDGTHTATWVGLTEDFDDATANGSDKSGASKSFATVQTNLTVSCTWNNTPVRQVFVIASFEVDTSASTSPAVITMTPSVQAPTVTGAASTSPAVISATLLIQAPTVSAIANPWSNRTKNTGSWTNQTKNT